jgi:uncharacterized protein (TIGR00369 family)
MEGKKVAESAIELVQQMTPQDSNMAGNVHGGVIMKLIDNTASIVAARHTSGNVVTASIDRLDFINPGYVGDLLRIKASLNYVGNTSMEIGVKVEAENFITGDIRKVAFSYLTFVALDNELKPRKVPGLILETDEDIRRNNDAKIRFELRKEARRKRKNN